MLRPFKTVDIRFGEPIDFYARYGDRIDDRLVLRQITDELMFEIADLSGQTYIDRYASRQAASGPAASGPAALAGLQPSAAAPRSADGAVAVTAR
jgi:1-acyl-sn-glycerol-3-phosphate acyltransferase